MEKGPSSTVAEPMPPPVAEPVAESPVVLVGNPNVGKSVLFGALTGRYVIVSNYPGTTVEVARGSVTVDGRPLPLVDTPGIQSLIPTSDDERVTRDILFSDVDPVVALVIDAKNPVRGLSLALEIAECNLRFAIVLNMSDEAEHRGVQIDAARLAERFGVPVVETVATRKRGMDALVVALAEARRSSARVEYPREILDAALRIGALEEGETPATGRAVLALGSPELSTTMLTGSVDPDLIRQIREEAAISAGGALGGLIQHAKLQTARKLVDEHVRLDTEAAPRSQFLGRMLVHPVWGWPVLAAVLYVIYLAVGVLGAGVLVDLLETTVFGSWINPAVTRLVETLLPWAPVQDFLVGEFGAVTMGMTYALAIVLPIVAIFFLVFSILEDTGYLPRLAVMLDRLFRTMGLNGKAVLPMILGLGCDTMATMTTRILDTRKERVQVTLLLALGVPCSAQLGVILGMVSGLGIVAVGVWTAVVATTVFIVGYLSARLIPGESSDFILELPPLRAPSLLNTGLKTLARVEWYAREVVPVFLIGTASLFVLDRIGWLSRLTDAMSPLVVDWLGLPVEVSGAFLVGFLRRDYGAAGLFAVARDGGLGPEQIVVSLVVITLFMPCFANFLMIVREHGWKTAAAVTAVVFPIAFLLGGLVLRFLQAFPIL